MIITIIARDDYLWNFFFFLDLISTVSLLFDITIITNIVFYGGGGSSVTNTVSLARAGRASRVGARYFKKYI